MGDALNGPSIELAMEDSQARASHAVIAELAAELVASQCPARWSLGRHEHMHSTTVVLCLRLARGGAWMLTREIRRYPS